MGRAVFICALISLQLLGCLSKECPDYRKDVQWMNGDKGFEGSSHPKSARKCQHWCQNYYTWNDGNPYGRRYPCEGWSFWAEPGVWSNSTWCYLFGNTTGGESLESTGSSAPGAVSGLKYDCNKGSLPTIAEMLLEGVASLNLNKTNWKYIMAEDTDMNQDGDVSDIELEHKFESYMEQLFKMMDQDKNGIVTEEELMSLRIDLPGLNKIFDAVLENFPTKTMFFVVDGNRDGILDESDFLLQEMPFYGPVGGSESTEYGTPAPPPRRTQIQLKGGKNKNEGRVEGYYSGGSIGGITQNEGNVICKSLGYKGLKKVVDKNSEEYFGYLGRTSTTYTCNGNEEMLEDCSKKHCASCQAMGVICEEEIKGSLRLVGGKDASSGDIFLGNKGLGCAPYKSDWNQKQAEVICRELGFPGVIKTTGRGAFTKYMKPRPGLVSKQFRCQGDEKKLFDCPMEDVRKYCSSYDVQGIVCNNKDGVNKMIENKFLEEITYWRHGWKDWEKWGRLLFIADVNNDGKLSKDEIIAKAKEYIEIMFNFMDQTRDGFMSVKDLSSLHMTIGPIHQVVDLIFENTEKDREIDMMRPVIMGKDVFQYLGFRNVKEFDMNNDNKLNADDFYLLSRRQMEKNMQLIPVVSKKLDKNQDGQLQWQEVRDFMDNIFKKLDIDRDGALTFEDAFSFMQENGVSCLSLLEWQSFLPSFTEAVDTQFGAMMSYFFKELDEDRNGKIDLKEFQQLHAPCAINRRELDLGPSRIRCKRVIDHFFDNRKGFNFVFPCLPFTGRHCGGPLRSRDQDGMAEAACKMLS